jgi:hypothetical protein
MSKVWRRLQKIGKRAYKYEYSFNEFSLQMSINKDWQPNKLVVVWTRNGRRFSSEPISWEPELGNPYETTTQWPHTNIVHFNITLYKGTTGNEPFEDKKWEIIIEDVKNKSLKFSFKFKILIFKKKIKGKLGRN